MLAACAVLILTGQTDLPHHHWEQTTPELLRAIADQTPCTARVLEQPAGLTAAQLTGVSIVLINYNGPRLPAAAEQALEAFVRGGGGLLAFHHALYGTWFGHVLGTDGRWRKGPDDGWAGWRAMIAAAWDPALLGHTKRGPFNVRCGGHPVCPEGEFGTDDELYHRFQVEASATRVAVAWSDPAASGTGRDEPVAWTNRYGKGRVFFTTLGHDARALAQPGVQKLFGRAASWAAGEAVQ
jgi:type 1 glutamine amidotransferase